MEVISGNLHLMLKQQQITQKELARRSGVTPKTVSSVINRKDVNLRSLCCLQAGLGCDFSELFCENGKAELRISININPDKRTSKNKVRELMQYVKQLYPDE